MKKIKMIIGLTFFASISIYATNWCAESHCSNVADEMNRFCVANGMAGKPFLSIVNGVNCYCMCSCAASFTAIELSDHSEISLGELTEQQAVHSPMSLLQTNVVAKKLQSVLTDNPVKIRRVEIGNGSHLLVSCDHVFITADMRVVRADMLKVGDKVLNSNLQPVEVKFNKEEHFSGTLVNAIVNESDTKIRNHLIVLNGTLSGDWLVQANYSAFDAEVDARLGNLPVLSK